MHRIPMISPLSDRSGILSFSMIFPPTASLSDCSMVTKLSRSA